MANSEPSCARGRERLGGEDALGIDAADGRHNLSNSEREPVLHQSESTVKPLAGELLHQFFERKASSNPHAIALRCEGESLTYATLNSRANELAQYLGTLGVGPEVLVGLHLERSLQLIVALLGTLKAGGAFLPLDPAYPSGRLTYILKDSSPRLVITETKLRPRLPTSAAGVVVLDTINLCAPTDECRASNSTSPMLTPASLAYVIYTSGSTGAPKGVASEHRGMVNRILAQASVAPFADDDICCQKTSIGFVDALFEILGPLSYGCALVIAPELAAKNPIALASIIERERVTRLISVPSLAQALVESRDTIRALRGLRHWTLSGEELSERLARRLLGALPNCRFTNLYGSSEVTADATWFELESFEGGRVPIGRPMANTRVYILDGDKNPVPVGLVGEIYVGGVGVARGYWNNAGLTAESFAPDPFHADGKERMYRMGDLGRWTLGGVLEYRGRDDHQVKIRGSRIELGEIETQLMRHPEVKEAVVTTRGAASGELHLVAYVVGENPGDPPGGDALQQHLEAVLPDYMIPKAFVMQKTFRLTASGKVDRGSLPPPSLASYVTRPYEQPKGELEEALSNVWKVLLHVERVGRYDNFFELGGSSLLVVDMIEQLRERALSLEGKDVFALATLSELAATLTPITNCQPTPQNDIPLDCEKVTPEMVPLAQIEAEDLRRIIQYVPGGSRNVQDVYPLAPLQEGMLFHCALDNQEEDTYAVLKLLAVSRREDLDKLIAAMRWAVARHDILRTAFVWENVSRPLQVVCRNAPLLVEEIPLDPSQDSLAQLKEHMSGQPRRLDVRQAPLLQLKVAADPNSARCFALVRMHHLICDEESFDILLSEVTAHMAGKAHELSAPIPYRDHVFHSILMAARCAPAAFFKGKIGDVSQPAAPFAVLETRGSTREISEEQVALGRDFTSSIRLEARKSGVTVATLVHAAWALVVASTSTQDDVVYGTVIRGGLQGGGVARHAFGMLINTVPLRINLRDLAARELLQKTQGELAALLEYSQVSLAEVKQYSAISGSTPLFTCLLNYRHGRADVEATLSSSGGIEVLSTVEATNYPISLSVDEAGDGLVLITKTQSQIDPQRVLGYMVTALKSLISALRSESEVPVLALPILSDKERDQVVEAFNATRGARLKIGMPHELLENRICISPNAEAASDEGYSLTYAELNVKANQLAAYLMSQGVGRNKLVGLCVERGVEVIVGILGIWKAGGAYLPLDPGYPTERLAYILEDAAPTLVLTQGHLKGRLPLACMKITAIDADWAEIAKEATDAPAIGCGGPTPEDLAYAIYTSGSTGNPKGVLVEHRNVLTLWSSLEQIYREFASINRIGLNAPINFDSSVKQLIQVFSGRSVYIISDATRKDPLALLRCIEERQIECIDCTPSQLKAWIEAGLLRRPGRKLRLVLVGGEAIDSKLWSELSKQTETIFYNLYGPTECTVDVTAARLSASESGPHIGRPMENRRVYILGLQSQPTPIGVAGEICIGGAGVARGYLNRSELTAERFVPDPFVSEPGSRMYRTGDRGLWRADGNIEYLGRDDGQVKVRGFRIELGEIEAALIRDGKLKAAVVLMREEEPGERQLVAYVIARNDTVAPSSEDLRKRLRDALPEYMVPATCVVLDEFPLTPSGKLDRKALPKPKQGAHARSHFEPPLGEVEETLAGIWRTLLRTERVGRRDDFFEIGGNSLVAMRVIAQVRNRLETNLAIRTVFEYPTLLEMANVISKQLCGRVGSEEV
jgi:amino acid adenylation domain-containing protein